VKGGVDIIGTHLGGGDLETALGRARTGQGSAPSCRCRRRARQ
jgi:hypothetical protein